MAVIETESGWSRATTYPPSPWYPELAFCLALMVQAAVVLTATYLPYCDAPDHLARWVMINRYWAGDPAAGVVIVPRPSNYLIADMMGAALVHLIGPRTALKLVAVILSLLPGVGLYTLLRTVAPVLRGWALVGLLLGINRYFLLGFLNYQLALGLLLLWLAMYWGFKPRLNMVRIAALAAFGVFLSQVHLSSIAILVIVVGSDALVDAIRVGRRWRCKEALSSILMPLSTLTIPLLVVASTPSGTAGSASASTYHHVLQFRSPIRKCLQIVGPFFTLSALESAILVLGYFASAGTFLWFVCRPGRWNRTILAVAALLFCFAIFPVSIRGTYDVDVRFLLPAYFLIFASRTPIGTGDELSRKGLLVPMLACLLHDGSVGLECGRIDEELSRCYEVLQRIPTGQTVLEIVVQEPPFGVPIYEHFAQWYIVEKNGASPGHSARRQCPISSTFALQTPFDTIQIWDG